MATGRRAVVVFPYPWMPSSAPWRRRLARWCTRRLVGTLAHIAPDSVPTADNPGPLVGAGGAGATGGGPPPTKPPSWPRCSLATHARLGALLLLWLTLVVVASVTGGLLVLFWLGQLELLHSLLAALWRVAHVDWHLWPPPQWLAVVAPPWWQAASASGGDASAAGATSASPSASAGASGQGAASSCLLPGTCPAQAGLG
jgi:hypothetical protein